MVTSEFGHAAQCPLVIAPDGAEYNVQNIRRNALRLLRPTRLRVREIDLLRNTVRRVQDWPYSTFHQYVEASVYPVGWCGDVDVDVRGDE